MTDAAETLSPVAQHVIAKCGGVPKIMAYTGLSRPQVHKFTYPRSRGGTGGTIPQWHWAAILAGAAEDEVDLSELDFIAVPSGRADWPKTDDHQAGAA